MGRRIEDTTAGRVASAYEEIVSLGDGSRRPELGEQATRMRQEFQRRTGAFGPEDPWFEARASAFWDDALATQGFARLAADELDEDVQAIGARIARAHRGFFVVDDVDARGACLVDAWSGAELYVRPLDESQVLTLEHAEGAMDARVTSAPGTSDLFLLPGAYHHAADALEPAIAVLAAAHERGMETREVLDALLRMDLVFRSSSRVKAAFAYQPKALSR